MRPDPLEVAFDVILNRPILSASLARYRRWFRKVPRPTPAQVEDFVGYVSEAHSWYKHLPLLRPGHAFTFFLDPGAGMAVRDLPFGFCAARRSVPTDLWHHAHLDTTEWRRRFGLLSYRAQPAPAEPAVVHRGVRRTRIPAEVMEAGTVVLNGILHPFSTVMLDLSREGNERDAERAAEPVRWPEESGGRSALDAALEVAHAEREAQAGAPLVVRTDADAVAEAQRVEAHRRAELDAALAPERSRQQRLARDAIERMLDRVHG